jgi:hypothetical protein
MTKQPEQMDLLLMTMTGSGFTFRYTATESEIFFAQSLDKINASALD